MKRTILAIWRSGLIQEMVWRLGVMARRFLGWYVRNARRTVPATLCGLFTYWLASLFASVHWTHVIFDWALGPLGIPVFYLVVTGVGVYQGWNLLPPADRR